MTQFCTEVISFGLLSSNSLRRDIYNIVTLLDVRVIKFIKVNVGPHDLDTYNICVQAKINSKFLRVE